MAPLRTATMLSLILPLLLVAPSCAAQSRGADPESPPAEPVVRVGVQVNVSQLIIASDGKIRIWRRGSGQRGSILGPNVHLRLLPTRMSAAAWASTAGTKTVPEWGIAMSSVRTGQIGVFAEELVFEPVSPGKPLRIDGKEYRGEAIIRISDPGRMTAINVLHMEDYLRGVVPPEVGRSPHLEPAVLQAQAIAARSYTLFYMGRHADQGFDLMDTPIDQVYEGLGGETDAANAAIDATRGVVAVYDGRPIRANYCSTCGGHTEASGTVWPGEAFPYLKPIKDKAAGAGVLCGSSPHYRWTETWTCDELQDILLRHLPQEAPESKKHGPTKIKDLEVIRRSASGRADIIAVETDRGTYEVKADRIRWLLRRPDGKPLRSTYIRDPKRKGKGPNCTITLEGAGYGHGVGLCQVGAIELAKRGRTASEILRHYYRGISFARWW